MTAIISRVSRAVSRWTMRLCIGLVFVMLALLTTQLVARYFFGSPPSWTEEVAITLFGWVIMLAGSVGVRENFHVAIDLFTRDKPSRKQAGMAKLVLLLTVGFGAVLTYAGYAYLMETRGLTSAALQYPIEALHLSALVAGILICFHAFARFIERSDTPS